MCASSIYFTQNFFFFNSGMSLMKIPVLLIALILINDVAAEKHRKHSRKYSLFPDYDNDLSLWIDEPQVKRFSGELFKI